MAINIRKAATEDSEALWALKTKAIQKIDGKYYTQHTIKAWASSDTANDFKSSIQQLEYYIAYKDNCIAGMGFLNKNTGEIGGIFVTPNFQRKNIGSQILQHLEKIAQEHNIKVLYLDATFNAEPFYKAAGYFSITTSKYHHQSGLILNCVRMEKNINVHRIKNKSYTVVVECAIEHNGKFLIIKRPAGKHAGGLLAFPGGKLDKQDEAHSCDILRHSVKREVVEEVGLHLVDPLHYIASSHFIDSDGHQIIATTFHCIVDKTILNVIPCQREVSQYYWMNATEINQANNAPDWLKNDIKLIIPSTLL